MPIDVERLGACAMLPWRRAVIARLKPHSRLIFADGRGMSLFQILPQGAP